VLKSIYRKGMQFLRRHALWDIVC